MSKTKQTPSRRKASVAKAVVAPRSTSEKIFETDSTYFLKLVVFTLLGTMWIKFETPVTWLGFLFNALPLGFFVGLLLVNRLEKHQSDRKIWYATLLIVTIICYNAPAGIVI